MVSHKPLVKLLSGFTKHGSQTFDVMVVPKHFGSVRQPSTIGKVAPIKTTSDLEPTFLHIYGTFEPCAGFHFDKAAEHNHRAPSQKSQKEAVETKWFKHVLAKRLAKLQGSPIPFALCRVWGIHGTIPRVPRYWGVRPSYQVINQAPACCRRPSAH